ncbi:MAG: cysteine-rich KTR domain-containing protein [Dysosmobacter sp.]|nr:cysteine-rich KTR domain-containing protein [Dysosmobacter sp.]
MRLESTLTVKGGWLICPACRRKKIIKLNQETKAASLPLFCRTCRTEFFVNIDGSLCGNAFW